MKKNCIIGGGLTGLSVAHFLDEECVILEKDDVAGGLCRSFKKGPFIYDIGGHIIFSKDKEVLDFMVNILGKNCKRQYRNNKIYYKGRYVKYPFENSLSELPLRDRLSCIYYFLNNNYPKPTNFRQWIYHLFGKGISDAYLVPYNEKIWKYPLDEIGLEWVDRIPKPPAQDVIKSAIGIRTEGYTHQLYFYYPIHGGIEALIDSITVSFPKDKVELKLKSEVKSITRTGNGWLVKTAAGETTEAERIISTMPIFHLIDCIKDVPAEVREAVDKLVFNRLYVVLIGVKNPNIKDKQALYTPARDVIFHRILYNGYFGDEYTGVENSSITAEITFAPGSDLEELTDEEVVGRVISDLEKLGQIKADEVIETEIKRIPYAYIIYDKNYKAKIDVIRKYFADEGIHLCGRFSEFEYINMDACIRHAMELAKELKKK